jgi:hypothetical protein
MLTAWHAEVVETKLKISPEVLQSVMKTGHLLLIIFMFSI